MLLHQKEKLNFLLVTFYSFFLWFQRDLDAAALLVWWNFLDFGGVFLGITVSENTTHEMKTWGWFSRNAPNDNFEKISSSSRILTLQMQMLILGDIFRCAVYYLAETFNV